MVADAPTYPGTPRGIPVAAAIRSGRLLTGADFDPESLRRDRNGNFWFGDEFGPFLFKTDGTGTVLRAEIPLPDVFSPDNPHRGGRASNVASLTGIRRHGCESRWYIACIRWWKGPSRAIRREPFACHEFDVDAERYTGRSFMYPA